MTTPQILGAIILGAIILLLIAVLAFGGAWAVRETQALKASSKEDVDELARQDLEIETLSEEKRRRLNPPLCRCQISDRFQRTTAAKFWHGPMPSPAAFSESSDAATAAWDEFESTRPQPGIRTGREHVRPVPPRFNSYAEFRAAKNPKATVNE